MEIIITTTIVTIMIIIIIIIIVDRKIQLLINQKLTTHPIRIGVVIKILNGNQIQLQWQFKHQLQYQSINQYNLITQDELMSYIMALI